MWLFTPFGFFSVVAHRDDDDALLVRSRARKDLEFLAARLVNPASPARGERVTSIEHTPDRDYPYRMVVTRAELDVLMTAFIRDELIYYNFKSECGEVDRLKWRELHAVWETMRGHEDGQARAGRGKLEPCPPSLPRSRSRAH